MNRFLNMICIVFFVGLFSAGNIFALEPVNAGFGKVKIDGLLQGRYTVDFSNTIDQFKLRRAELKLSGEINEKITWALMFDPARAIDTGEAAPTTTDVSANKQKKRILQDLKLNLKQIPYTTVTAGQYKIPFSMEGLRSSSKLYTIERAMLNAKGKLGDFRDIGLQITSGVKAAKVTLGVFNGEGQNVTDKNEYKDIALRFTSEPISGLHFGVAHYDGKVGGAKTVKAKTGIELEYAHNMFFISSEVAFGRTFSSGYKKQRGWYVVAGFNVMEELQLVVKGDSWDPDTNKSGDRLDEITLGVNAFMLKHRAKVQLNYTKKMEEKGSEIWNDTIVVQLQLGF